MTVTLDKAIIGSRRNRFIDPGMRVSQENGTNLLTLMSGGVYYVSDSVWAQRVGATGGATVQRVNIPTPGGSSWRNRLTVTAANAAPGASDLLRFATSIEGVDVADLNFGRASAKTLTVRLGLRSSVAGTFTVALSNASASRCWLGTITISASEVGVDVSKPLVLTADTSGTWDVGNLVGLSLNITLCCGASFQGTAGWQNGGFNGHASGTNLMATNGATFDVFDIGFYEGSVAPPFELSSYAEDLQRSLRYYTKTYLAAIPPGSPNEARGAITRITDAARSYHALFWQLPVEMRVTPSFTCFNPVTGSANSIRNINSNADLPCNLQGDSKSAMFVINNTNTDGTIVAHGVANARL